MSRFGLDKEGMKRRIAGYGGADIFFKRMMRIDSLLMEAEAVLAGSGVSELPSIGYSSQSADIRKLETNLDILAEYPHKLIAELHDTYDADFAIRMVDAYEELASIKIDEISYTDSSTSELITIPPSILNTLINDVSEIEGNLLHESINRLASIYRITEDEALKEDVELMLKNRFRQEKYNQSSEMAELFPLLEKEDTIAGYEVNNKDIQEKFNKLLDGGKDITYEDRVNIKYMAYTAAEPCRSVFLNNLDEIRIRKTDLESGAYYSRVSGKQGVYYTYQEYFKYDPRGPYVTFFHECGHALDHNINKLNYKGYDTTAFSMNSFNPAIRQNETWDIRKAIEYDVFDNPNNKHSVDYYAMRCIAQHNSILSQADAELKILNIKKALKNNDITFLTVDEKSIYTYVVNNITTDTRGVQREAASDVYGGVTYNVLKGGYGHKYEYYDKAWDKNDGDYYNPVKELWAEWFAYQMSGNTVMANNVEEYFPTANMVLGELANELSK